MEKMIKFKIDGQEYVALENETVLDVCKKNNIFIPTFCHDERFKAYYDAIKPGCAVFLRDAMRVYITE